MSGGVDSLRTADLLKAQGNEIFALHMRILPASDPGGWSNDSILSDAEQRVKSLTSSLGISLTVVDMREAFRKQVIQPFIRAYQKGLTPNPCVICNPTIKFGALLGEAKRLGADALATGHYVRLLPSHEGSGRHQLYRARDLNKDQSYFLYGLTQQQLSCALFPLGNVRKDEVLRWAQKEGYSSLVPQESQEICFIPSGKYQEFLLEEFGADAAPMNGPIVDMDDNYLAQHKGVFAYTVGQRRGLGIASSAPYYVVELEPATNTVRVGRAHHLYRSGLKAENTNWVSIEPPAKALRGQVRIRNQHRPSPAWIIPLKGCNDVLVRFDEPQRAVTPGQAAVFYQGDQVLGGGTIARSTGL